MGSEMMLMEGAVRRGNDVPSFNPHHILIVGGPGANDPAYEEALWAFYCPRAGEIPDEAFVDSIEKPNKVYETIHVFKDGKGESSRLLVIGHRRCVKGARIVWDKQEAAGVPLKERVQVRVQVHSDLTDEQIWDLNVDENDMKKSFTMVQKAQQLAHYYQRVQSLAKVAERFRCSPQDVSNKLAILKLAPQVQDLIAQGKIAGDHAPTLAQLNRTQQVKAADEIVSKGMSGALVKEAVKAVKQGKAISSVELTRARPRTLVEKVASYAREQATGLSHEDIGDINERDMLLIAAVLDWQTGKDFSHKGLAAIVEQVRGKKGVTPAEAADGF